MDDIYPMLNKIRAGGRLSTEDRQILPGFLDEMHIPLELGAAPEGFRLATGKQARGATGRVALQCYFLLLGRKFMGANFTQNDKRMEFFNLHLGFHIMRGHFMGKYAPGMYCCATCTLSVFPLYCNRALFGFDNKRMEQNVIDAIETGKPPFTTKYDQKYAQWALGFRTG